MLKPLSYGLSVKWKITKTLLILLAESNFKALYILIIIDTCLPVFLSDYSHYLTSYTQEF